MEDRNRKDGSTLDEGSGLARTFKEVVREEHGEGKEVNWKSFRDGIRIHNAGNAWAAAVAEGANGRPRAGIGSLSRTSSMRAPQNSHAWVGGGFNEERDEAVAALLQQRPPPTKEQPMKMSLMALLADNGGYSDGDEDADDEEGNEGGVAGKKEKEGFNDEDEAENEGEMMHACCVCMVRHKGAAFIPCGHTFCRLCSRELWVSRGNCPLCNGFILEILDIF